MGDDADTIDISSTIGFWPSACSGNHVERTAEDCPGGGQFRILRHLFGDSEIGKQWSPIESVKNVGGFYVPVNSPLLVRKMRRIGYAFHHIQCLFFRAFGLDLLFEINRRRRIPSTCKPTSQWRRCRNCGDVRMSERDNDSPFVEKSLEKVRLPRLIGVHGFENDLPT